MKTSARFLGWVILVSSFFSCQKDKLNDEMNEKTPGTFSLTQVASAKSASLKSTKTNTSAVFDFGDIKASKEYYFLLTNGGDEPIFDITMSFSNSSFTISPKKIDYLSGGILLQEENTSIIPMLTVGITHGINLNGVGYSDLLPMGVNSSGLEIKGKTLTNGDTVEITGNYDFSAFARVMDIELYEDNVKINLETPRGSMSSNLGGLGFMRYYSIYDTTIISIKNSGNVSIDLYYGDTDHQNQKISLNPSDSTSMNLPDFMNVLVLDSEGTITDNARIQLGDDGKGYIALIKDDHR